MRETPYNWHYEECFDEYRNIVFHALSTAEKDKVRATTSCFFPDLTSDIQQYLYTSFDGDTVLLPTKPSGDLRNYINTSPLWTIARQNPKPFIILGNLANKLEDWAGTLPLGS